MKASSSCRAFPRLAFPLAFAVALLVPDFARADDGPIQTSSASTQVADNHLGVNSLGFLGFMRLNVAHWAIGYDRVVTGGHALHAAATGVHVHDPSEGDALHIWTFGAQLGYRYQLRRGDGPFFGLLGGYRLGFGRRVTSQEDHFDIKQWSVLPQIGYRWNVPSLRLSIATSAGLGIGPYTVTPDDDGEMADQAADHAKTALGPTPLAAEFELTFAFAF
jgi:hypothetical protein